MRKDIGNRYLVEDNLLEVEATMFQTNPKAKATFQHCTIDIKYTRLDDLDTQKKIIIKIITL